MDQPTLLSLFAESVFLPEGWGHNVLIRADEAGNIAQIAPDTDRNKALRDGAIEASGPVLPGLPNVHAQAVLRVMAGAAERRAGHLRLQGAGGRHGRFASSLIGGWRPQGDALPDAVEAGSDRQAKGAQADSIDDFWTWRLEMYEALSRLTPGMVQAIAAQAYLEMVKHGYTAVAEVHGLHHQPNGRPYRRPEEMSLRLIAAAEEVGIGLTLLPVLYQASNCGGQPPAREQARFVTSTRRFMELMAGLVTFLRDKPDIRLGVAPHSLRAVTAEALADIALAMTQQDPSAPIHIHVAETEKEVAACLAWSGKRPLEWLLAEAPIGPRWCLVHATQALEHELRGVAASGAVIGLCPTTEADLADGFFPLASFLAMGGRVGIGSGIGLNANPAEELRWLEFGQRLLYRRRCVVPWAVAEGPKAVGGHDQGSGSTAAALLRRVLAGGAQALARPIGALAVGRRCDLVVLEGQHPTLFDRLEDGILDAFLFANAGNPVRDVAIGGRWVIRSGRHGKEDAIRDAYRKALWKWLT